MRSSRCSRAMQLPLEKIIRFCHLIMKHVSVVNSWAAFIGNLGRVIEAYDMVSGTSHASYLHI